MQQQMCDRATTTCRAAEIREHVQPLGNHSAGASEDLGGLREIVPLRAHARPQRVRRLMGILETTAVCPFRRQAGGRLRVRATLGHQQYAQLPMPATPCKTPHQSSPAPLCLLENRPRREAERRFDRSSPWLCLLLVCLWLGAQVQGAEPVRVGILGLDNYQGVAYTQLFNNPLAEGELAGLRVVAVLPDPSPDYPESRALTERWLGQIGQLYQNPKQGSPTVAPPQVVGSLNEFLQKVDVVLMASLDGHQHLAQATPVLQAGKPLFITRPLAATPEEANAILDVAHRTGTPCWSSSQHRFSPGFSGMRDHPEVGSVLGCDVYGGFDLKNSAGADAFIRPLHSLETVFAIMGPGCVSVASHSTPTAEIYVMAWGDGRVATYRGIKEGAVKWSATVFGSKGVSTAGVYGHGIPVQGVVPTKDKYMGYEGIGVEIAKFFKGGPVPVAASETRQIFALLQAAQSSQQQQGARVEVRLP